jgi:hypothetical protein
MSQGPPKQTSILVGLDCHHTVKRPSLSFFFEGLSSDEFILSSKRGVRSMKKEKRQFHLIKEEEKIRQVTHWDLDYLPTKEILDLYQRESGPPTKKKTEHVTDESNSKGYRCC